MPLFLATVDGDPGSNFPNRLDPETEAPPTEEQVDAYRQAVKMLSEVFDDGGLRGKVTWFVNELDVGWSRHYADLLREMIACGDTVGLHVHHNGCFSPRRLQDRDSVLRAASKAKENVEAITGRDCLCHRSGCYFQAEYVYSALRDLGFQALSDVFPGFSGKTKAGLDLDNTRVPLNAKPWRHDESNWMEWTSQTGHFLHVPVAGSGISALENLPQKSKGQGIETVCWGIHPHELQNADGAVNDEAVGRLHDALGKLQRELEPECLNFESSQE